jgi:hypothetical protein
MSIGQGRNESCQRELSKSGKYRSRGRRRNKEEVTDPIVSRPSIKVENLKHESLAGLDGVLSDEEVGGLFPNGIERSQDAAGRPEG